MPDVTSGAIPRPARDAAGIHESTVVHNTKFSQAGALRRAEHALTPRYNHTG